MKENGGKLPTGYKGAFEKFMDTEMAKIKKPKKISAIADRELCQWLDEDSDSSDSDSNGFCGAIWKAVGPNCCDPFASNVEFPPICKLASNKTPTMNSFGALSDLDDSTTSTGSDGTTIEQATADLQNWAHRVTTGKRPRKKDFVIKTNDDIEKLEKLLCGANREKATKALRQIETDHLDELATLVERKASSLKAVEKASRRVWAMVDSGSFVTIANCSKHFPGHRVLPSHGSKTGVTYCNASGGDIPNRGETTVTHLLDNGSEIDIPFQDGDVQIPILSVKDFVRKDSVVRFKHNGGTIKLPSGSRMTFVEKYGVYFICLNVTSGNIDGNHSSEQHLNSIHAIERAIDVLDPKHLAVEDAVAAIPPPPDVDQKRCGCCRPKRRSGFARPA